MAEPYSREELLKFHDYLADKGIRNPNTVAARKAAANKMLAMLDEQEASDLRQVNLEQVSERFFNKNKSDFTPESLGTYRSRLKSAVDEFIRYVADPTSLKATSQKTRNTSTSGDSSDRKAKLSALQESGQTQHRAPQMTQETAVQIPIRDGMIVRLLGLPADLKKREAQKISNVVMAFAEIEDI
jgi:hypothetical protein